MSYLGMYVIARWHAIGHQHINEMWMEDDAVQKTMFCDIVWKYISVAIVQCFWRKNYAAEALTMLSQYYVMTLPPTLAEQLKSWSSWVQHQLWPTHGEPKSVGEDRYRRIRCKQIREGNSQRKPSYWSTFVCHCFFDKDHSLVESILIRQRELILRKLFNSN